MAVSTNVETESFEAAADLSAKRYYLAKLDANGKAVLGAAAADRVKGPIYEPAVSGLAVAVAIAGQPKVILGGTVAPGDRLTSDAAGKAIVTVTSGHYVFGEAIEAGVAGDIVQFDKKDYYVP